MVVINKEMTWKDVIKTYPDMWVAIGEYKGWGPDVESGMIKFVLTDDEYPTYRAAHIKDGLYYKRTTIRRGMGGSISGENGGYTVV